MAYHSIRLPEYWTQTTIGDDGKEIKKLVSEKPFKDWHYTQRRAYIFAIMLQKGDYRRINRKELAELFGKSTTQIHFDIGKIRDEVSKEMGTDADQIIEIVCKHAIEKLQENGEYRQAVQVVKDYLSMLVDLGKVDKVPEKAEINMSLGITEDDLLAGAKAIEAKQRAKHRRDEDGD